MSRFPDILATCQALKAQGLLRLQRTDKGTLKLAAPESGIVKVMAEIDPKTGQWTATNGTEGEGLFALLRYLDTPLDAVMASVR